MMRFVCCMQRPCKYLFYSRYFRFIIFIVFRERIRRIIIVIIVLRYFNTLRSSMAVTFYCFRLMIIFRVSVCMRDGTTLLLLLFMKLLIIYMVLECRLRMGLFSRFGKIFSKHSIIIQSFWQ